MKTLLCGLTLVCFVLFPALLPPSRALSAHGFIFISHSFSQTKSLQDEDVIVLCALTYGLFFGFSFFPPPSGPIPALCLRIVPSLSHTLSPETRHLSMRTLLYGLTFFFPHFLALYMVPSVFFDLVPPPTSPPTVWPLFCVFILTCDVLLLLATGWRRLIRCLIFIGHFPPKSLFCKK